MKAYSILKGSAFGPDVIKVAVAAFDEAWASVGGKFAESEHPMAREALAQCIIISTRDDNNEVGRLRDAGIRALRAKYPSRFGGEGAQSGQNSKIAELPSSLLGMELGSRD